MVSNERGSKCSFAINLDKHYDLGLIHEDLDYSVLIMRGIKQGSLKILLV